jgi:pyridoxamine 5'-phosphate oxidase
VEVVTPAEADAYFASRAHGSQIASSISEQSRPLASRAEIMRRFADLEATTGTAPVPRPPHWSGFRIVPQQIEFWLDGQYRLHDRFRFTRAGGPWTYQRLNP